MSNPHVRIILESLQELELIAQELRDSSITLSLRFNQLAEFNNRLQHIESRWQNVQNSLELNDELRADIRANYTDEIERISELIAEITKLLERRDWVRRVARSSVLISALVRGLVEIGNRSLELLQETQQDQTDLAEQLRSTVAYLETHLLQNLLTS